MAKQVEQQAPKIEFPCDNYSIKVVGRKTEDYCEWVLACIKQHAPDLQVDKVQVVESSNGKFQSVRLAICAQSEAHLKTIHADLMASGRVQIVI